MRKSNKFAICGQLRAGKSTSKKDNVNHPSHYTAGKFETIEVIEHIVEGYSDPFVSHCVGTATKYLDRAPYKHEDITEDLRKARAYLDFAIEKLGGDNGKGTSE